MITKLFFREMVKIPNSLFLTPIDFNICSILIFFLNSIIKRHKFIAFNNYQKVPNGNINCYHNRISAYFVLPHTALEFTFSVRLVIHFMCCGTNIIYSIYYCHDKFNDDCYTISNYWFKIISLLG